MKKMRGRGIQYYRMEPNGYQIIAVPEGDSCQGAKSYRYSVSPVAKDALSIGEDDDDRRQSLPYLIKAVEVGEHQKVWGNQAERMPT